MSGSLIIGSRAGVQKNESRAGYIYAMAIENNYGSVSITKFY
jgi:hypothetical protein